ncbi:MAG: ABC transporter substrate-binding protein [Acidimicrobiales bacterium]
MRPARRSSTYALIAGSAAAVLMVGLLVPAVLGEPDRGQQATASTILEHIRPSDHDPRPAPVYATDQLVVGRPVPEGVRLIASDVGVNATTITIGVILVGLGAVSAFGIDTSSLNPAVQRVYWQDAIDRVNAAGGLAGRRLAAVYATGDILSTDSMRAACRVLTEDHHVFAVANVLGVTGDPILCVSRDHATPYLSIAGADPSYYRAGPVITLEPTTTRTLAVLFSVLAERSLIKGHRIGVVHDSGPGGVDTGTIRRTLAAVGGSLASDGPLQGDDPLVVTGQVSAAERRMQQQGVDTVVLLTNAVYGTVFATQADQDRYTPSYVLSDLGYATAGNSFLANMPPSFFRHVVAVTTTEVGRGEAGLPESPLDAGCRHSFERAVGRAAARDGGDAVAALASCALVQIVTMGVNGAGPNPTRAEFTHALAGQGAFAVPGFGRGLLAPGRLDAADDVQLAVARGDCQCFDVADGYRPAP